MYDFQFIATDDADWAQAFEFIDPTTNLPLDVSANGFEVQVTEGGGHWSRTLLDAKTDNATITRPDANTIQWIFTQAQMGCLCVGTTYKVGLRMTNDSGSIMVGTGSLAFVDGGMGS